MIMGLNFCYRVAIIDIKSDKLLLNVHIKKILENT